MAPRYMVTQADDPFKKYWWVILIGFGVTGMWLLMPMMGEKAIGSESVNRVEPKIDDNAEQTFAPDDSGPNLTMDAIARKKKDDGLMGSSLFQPLPDEEGAGLDETKAAATAGSASVGGGNLSNALKKVADGNGGWGDKQAQRGFNSPKLSGSSLSGMGSAGGGRAGSAGGGSGAFGSKNANVGFGTTKSLTDGPEEKGAASKGMAALRSAAAQAQQGLGSRSNDQASSSLRAAFDGSKGGNAIQGGGAAIAGGTYEALDSAPVNLKLSDPKLNEKKLEPPPGADVGQSDMDNSQFAKQLAMQMVGIVIGGAIGGPAGGMVSQVIMQAVQRQADQEEKVRKLEEQQQLDAAKRRMGASTGN